MVLSGGSSSVLRKALAALALRRSTSKMNATFRSPRCGECWILRMSSLVSLTEMMRDFLEGRIKKTSG